MCLIASIGAVTQLEAATIGLPWYSLALLGSIAGSILVPHKATSTTATTWLRDPGWLLTIPVGCLLALLATADTTGAQPQTWLIWIPIAVMCSFLGRVVGWWADTRVVGMRHPRQLVLVGPATARARIHDLVHHGSLGDVVIHAQIDPEHNEALRPALLAALATAPSPLVIVCSDDCQPAPAERVLVELHDQPVLVQWAPQLAPPRGAFSRAIEQPLIDICGAPLRPHQCALKWIEDRVLGAGILLLAAIPMTLVAIAVWITSPGPVLFVQRRHGLHGRVISVYKFRTMHDETRVAVVRHAPRWRLPAWLQRQQPALATNAMEAAALLAYEPLPTHAPRPADYEPTPAFRQTISGDPRLTSIGSFLRKTSLDELPQLFNVVLGDMSLVGPRPHAVQHNQEYSGRISRLMQRHHVKPGITGLAQISGARGATRTERDMRRRIALDLLYIRNWSLALDLRILALTAVRGFITRHP